MINLFKRLICLFRGHDWANKKGYPVHGYYNLPYPDSFCNRCTITGAKVLKLKEEVA